MSALKKKAKITEQCVACGCCVKICPLHAISIYKGVIAIVDEQSCVGCGKCANICPSSVISIASKERTRK